MSLVIIITPPPPTKPGTGTRNADMQTVIDHDAAHDALDKALASGHRIRVIDTTAD